MARFKIGKWVFWSDSNGWAVAEEYQGTTKEGEPITKTRHTSYAGTLKGILSLVPEKQLRTSDAESLQQVLQELQEVRNQISLAIDGGWHGEGR
jgi:hypothetical protein